MKTFTKEQLIKKYGGKQIYLDLYSHHFEFWDSKNGKYQTTYEIRQKTKTIKENCNLIEDCF